MLLRDTERIPMSDKTRSYHRVMTGSLVVQVSQQFRSIAKIRSDNCTDYISILTIVFMFCNIYCRLERIQ